LQKKKREDFPYRIRKKLSSLWKREDGRDFWEGLFKRLKDYRK
jgi:hypothetical protein